MSSPFIDTAINELETARATRPRLPVSAVSLFQNVIALNSLLQSFPHLIIYRLNKGMFTGYIAGSMRMMFSL